MANFISRSRESIRGLDVFWIQAHCAPVNDHLMELLIMVDACRRGLRPPDHRRDPLLRLMPAPTRKTAAANRFTAKWWPNLLVTSGVDRVAGPWNLAFLPDPGLFRYSL